MAPQRLRVHVSGSTLTLGPDDFIAAGGEGRVFAKGSRAYKIFHDSTAAPPSAKLAELEALDVPLAVLPTAPVFASRPGPGQRCAPIGYAMAWVDQAVSWGQSCTQAYKARNGTRPQDILTQVESLRASLVQLHAQGCVVVDLSENNVVLSGSAVHLIDVDSWQTRTHLPTAITPSIASPLFQPGDDGRYRAEQDWFAFAILSFTRLVGIHPFKGKHPRVRGLQARMAAGLSVLDPDVRTPPVCPAPQSRIGASLLDWYRHAFSGHAGLKAPPPFRHRAAPPSVPATLPASGLQPWVRTQAPIIAVLVAGAHLHIATTGGVEDETGTQWLRAADVLGLGLTDDHEPFALLGPLHSPRVAVRGMPEVPLPGPLDALTQARGTLFVKLRSRVAALDVRRLGKRAVPVLRDVARVLPRATRLFDGILVQDLFGTVRITLLGHRCGSPSFDLGQATPHLRPHDLVDARKDGDRVVLCSRTETGLREDALTLDPSGAVLSHDVELHADGHGTTFAHTAAHFVRLSPDGLVVRSPHGPCGGRQPLSIPGPGMLSTDGSNIAYTTTHAVYRINAHAVPRGQRTPSP